MKRFRTALVLSFIYLALGNITAIIGTENPSNEFLNSGFVGTLFAPYTFVAGMSTFAGWDLLSFILEIVIFVVTIPFFYFIVFMFQNINEQRRNSIHLRNK